MGKVSIMEPGEASRELCPARFFSVGVSAGAQASCCRHEEEDMVWNTRGHRATGGGETPTPVCPKVLPKTTPERQRESERGKRPATKHTLLNGKPEGGPYCMSY